MSSPLTHDLIPLLTLTSWVKAATVCGFSLQPILSELGIEADLSKLGSTRVPPLTLLQLLVACTQAGERAGVAEPRHYPFVLGESFAFEFLPELETFLTTSTTPREALRAVGWASELINPLMRLTLKEQGDEARVVLDFEIDLLTVEPPVSFVAEATLLGLRNIGRRLIGSNLPLRRVNWRHQRPAYAAEYERLFGVPNHFDQPETALVFDRQALDWRLQGAFPELHKQAEALVEQRVHDGRQAAAGGPPATLHEQIEQLLTQRPELMAGGVDTVAAELGLHLRTLQRRLKDEDHVYADIQAGVREHLARQWLAEARLDIETIALKLGYSDRRAFTNAFKRWTGSPPSQYREQSGGSREG
jgi:AraC-like DNA-binding protein